eukprot:647370-Rhodomonas_salina.2
MKRATNDAPNPYPGTLAQYQIRTLVRSLSTHSVPKSVPWYARSGLGPIAAIRYRSTGFRRRCARSVPHAILLYDIAVPDITKSSLRHCSLLYVSQTWCRGVGGVETDEEEGYDVSLHAACTPCSDILAQYRTPCCDR